MKILLFTNKKYKKYLEDIENNVKEKIAEAYQEGYTKGYEKGLHQGLISDKRGLFLNQNGLYWFNNTSENLSSE
jgi:hypothetical protein